MSPDTKSDPNPKRQVLDWEDLRAKSLQKGGFGEAREDIWPKLLHVPRAKEDVEENSSNGPPTDEKPPHQDERQIGLDTDRSFVLYPVEPKIDREALQADLHKLLVSLFRKRPRLSYFQGYHDIVTVLFLTLPPELQLVCVEKLSLHRLRDSMGSGLEPILGLLRVTKNILQLADPDFARILERSSPLPFYALSNLLTLFSHDMPSLSLIQHVFDYLLCRPPIAAVYLAAAIILSRKDEVIRLEEEDEDGMIHSLLSSLPNLMDDVQDLEKADDGSSLKSEDPPNDPDNTFFKDNEPNILDPSRFVEPPHKAESEDNQDHISDDLIVLSDVRRHSPPPNDTLAELLETTGPDRISPEHKHTDSSSEESAQLPEDEVDRLSRSSPLSRSRDLEIPHEESISYFNPVKVEQEDIHPHTPPPTFSSAPKLTSTKLFLTDLLKHADALYKEYPPSHSGLSLSSIMGPQSVIFTWSESPSGLPSDSTAEAMVSHPELVVYPYVEIDHRQKETSSDQGKDKAGKDGKAHRKRRKLRKSPFGQVEKKTMLAGTVIVLGVAMAVYGIKARNGNGYGLFFGITEGRPQASGAKEWRRLGGWVGGALAGMSEKLMNGLSTGP